MNEMFNAIKMRSRIYVALTKDTILWLLERLQVTETYLSLKCLYPLSSLELLSYANNNMFLNSLVREQKAKGYVAKITVKRTDW